MTRAIPEPKGLQKRVIVIVLDGAGIGALPDANYYGDEGSDTLGHVIKKHGPLNLKNLYAIGLGCLLDPGKPALPPTRARFYGRMAPISPGKDTTSGHWELAGLVLKKPFPLYPLGFPAGVIEAFEKAIGRKILGNIAASGTEIIEKLGREHMQSGHPIVYTSADSVFQVAAHDEVIKGEELYSWCEKARQILISDHAVGRVIARPFTGKPGSFVRTSGRRDYSLPPPGDTLLDISASAGLSVAVIGKVADIFAHRSISDHRPGGNNEAVAADLTAFMKEINKGLIWATFGDFDTVYGHRNDSEGFALALEKFDHHLTGIFEKMRKGDLLFITADHGCDPTYPTTDHTREYVPILAWGSLLPHNIDVGTRESFADLAAGAAEWLELKAPGYGKSFLNQSDRYNP